MFLEAYLNSPYGLGKSIIENLIIEFHEVYEHNIGKLLVKQLLELPA